MRALVQELGSTGHWPAIAERLGSGRTTAGVEQHWQILTGRRKRNTPNGGSHGGEEGVHAVALSAADAAAQGRPEYANSMGILAAGSEYAAAAQRASAGGMVMAFAPPIGQMPHLPHVTATVVGVVHTMDPAAAHAAAVHAANVHAAHAHAAAAHAAVSVAASAQPVDEPQAAPGTLPVVQPQWLTPPPLQGGENQPLPVEAPQWLPEATSLPAEAQAVVSEPAPMNELVSPHAASFSATEIPEPQHAAGFPAMEVPAMEVPAPQ